MKKINGKIILIDDSKYEKELLELALHQKNWNVKVEFFLSGEDALKYLKKTTDEIFLIISDMNMPKMSGLELKKIMDNDEELSNKSIPFIFASTSETSEQINNAYKYRVQGYFQKPLTIEEQAEMLDIIIRYWIICKHPNKK